MNSTYYRLDSNEVRRLIKDQGLKKWWVAEFSGVHRTTLRRWLSGRITKVRKDNLERLATILTARAETIAHPLTANTSPLQGHLD